jgi:hypothetical protein
MIAGDELAGFEGSKTLVRAREAVRCDASPTGALAMFLSLGGEPAEVGTPLHAVIGYRALSVDFSENGKFGKNGIDMVQHGPIMGVTFRW